MVCRIVGNILVGCIHRVVVCLEYARWILRSRNRVVVVTRDAIYGDVAGVAGKGWQWLEFSQWIVNHLVGAGHYRVAGVATVGRAVGGGSGKQEIVEIDAGLLVNVIFVVWVDQRQLGVLFSEEVANVGANELIIGPRIHKESVDGHAEDFRVAVG